MNDATRQRTAAAIAWTAAAGTAVLGLAHTGVRIPLISALGPAGSSPVPPAVIAFTVATLLFAAIAVGVRAGRAWARWLGLGVAALSILNGLSQFRGPATVIAIVLSAALIALLAKPFGQVGSVAQS